MKIKDITLIGALAAILFLIDQVFSFVPFLQFSMLLIVLFSRKLGSLKTSFIILIFVVLGYLLIEFNLLFIVFSIIGWLFVPLLSNTIFKNTRSVILIGLESILFSFLYSWIHIIPSCLIIESSIIEYLKIDIVFELTLAASSFVTIVFLYKPLEKVLDRFI
jgi:hypothetical protein